MQRFRIIVASLLALITLIGVFAGLKLAGIEERERLWQSLYNTPTNLRQYVIQELETDKSFFENVIEKVTKPKPAPTPIPEDTDVVTADSYIVGNLRTGQVYFEQNSTKVLPFASMSKLITALVATDQIKGTSTIVVASTTEPIPDTTDLKPGEQFSLNEMLHALLLPSSNLAAESIASADDRNHFLELMSGYAWEIGMPSAYFADPSGLSERNAGTARGFFAMAQYIYTKRPKILQMTTIEEFKVATTSLHGAHVFVNRHPFVTDPRFLGGKTGYTPAALDTMLTIMKIEGEPIAFIVLRSPNRRMQDTGLLIDRYLTNY